MQEEMQPPAALEADEVAVIDMPEFVVPPQPVAALASLPEPETANARVPPISQYIMPPSAGISPLSPISSALMAAAQKGGEEGSVRDPDYLKLAQHLLQPGAGFRLSSVLALSSYLGMSRLTLAPKLCRLLCAHFVFAKLSRHLVEQAFTSKFPKEALVFYLDYASYDETPLKTSIKGDRSVLEVGMGDAEEPGLPSEPDAGLPTTLTSSLWSQAVVCKILQTQCKYGMVVKLPNHFLHFFASFPAPLQLLERNTSEVLKQALTQNLGVSSWSRAFHAKSRLVCVDKAGSNAKAERGMLTDRQEGWSSGLFACEVHITSNIFKKTYQQLMPQHVTGMLRTALSLRSGAALGLFRRCLAATINQKLVLLAGSPARGALEHKQACMEIFLTDVSSSLLQRVIVASLPNGDWRRRDRVEFYYGTSEAPSRSSTVRLLSSGLCFALIAHKPSLWPQHRWTGADVALDELSRLEMVHGLLGSTYTMFMEKFTAGETVHEDMLQEPPLPPPPPRQAAVLEGESGQGLAPPAQLPSIAEEPLAAAAGDEAIPEEQRSAALHAQDRRVAQEWLAQRPFGSLVIMRLTMQPLTQMLHGQFAVVSEDFELEQRSKLAQTLLDQTPVQGCGRSFMLTEAAKGTLETGFFTQVLELWRNVKVWEVIDSNEVTVATNVLIFTLLARQASLVEELLASPHRQPPYSIFQLLDSKETAVQLEQLRPCELDGSTQHLLQTFGSFRSEELWHSLYMEAQVCATNISRVEAKHASVRRLMHHRSVQTWSLQAADASAEFLAQGFRRSVSSPLYKKEATASHTTKLRKVLE